ncbi:TetR/AcrR family transcriptional regulator [Nocardia crassostreae]|uniref:TetR/AcrR family transcriptional regulator n=1 Tax=Nocardia crassostreae TaxID=53428 RepID=UPI00082C85E9|nr:TetR/AcrR family transcriptional regulator [Nocardia crassostreae]
MGNREDLLTGARKAILERGLAKVTARDIAKAAGVSLAAIGYHFGSKDRLVTEAVTTGLGSMIGDDMDAAIRAAGEGRTLGDSLPETWNGLTDVVFRHRENLMLSIENGIQIARDPESQSFMVEVTAEAYNDLATVVGEAHPELSATEARAVGKLFYVLFQGMAMQALIAPAAEPLDGDDLERAVGAIRGG